MGRSLLGRAWDVLPGPVRRAVYEAHVREHRRRVLAAQRAEEAEGGHLDLTAAQLRRAQVVPDRDALFAGLPAGGAAAYVGRISPELATRLLHATRPATLYVVHAGAGAADVVSAISAACPSELRRGVLVPLVAASPEAPRSVPEGSLAWACLDVDGSEEEWLHALRSWAATLQPGGLLACARYYVDSERLDGAAPVRAVHRFCAEAGWEVRSVTHETHRRLSIAMARMDGEPAGVS